MKTPLEIGKSLAVWLVSGCDGRKSETCNEKSETVARAQTASQRMAAPGVLMSRDCLKYRQSTQRVTSRQGIEQESVFI